jgi:O-antigen ligase
MILFYILIVSMPLISQSFFGAQIGGITVEKYLGLICLIYALLYGIVHRRRPMFLAARQAWALLFFFTLATFSYLAAGQTDYSSALLLVYLSHFLFFFATGLLLNSTKRLRWTVIAIISAITWASLYIMRDWQLGITAYGASYRPGYVTGDANFFSASAVICLPIIYYFALGNRSRWERWYGLACFAITLPAMMVAASRGGFLGLIGASLALVLRSRRKLRNCLLITLPLVIALVLFPSSPLQRLIHPDQSDIEASEIRLELWKASWRMIHANPTLGVGLGNFKEVVRSYADPALDLRNMAHNTYLEIAAEMGIPSLLAFLAIFYFSFRSISRVRRNAAEIGMDLIFKVASGIEAGLVGFSVSIFFVSAEFLKLFWFVIFVSCCLPSLLTAARERDSLAVLPTTSDFGKPLEGGTMTIAERLHREATRNNYSRQVVFACAWVALVGGLLTSPSQPVEQDRFGGIRVRVGEKTKFFTVKTVGNRWVFVTPEGNAFWMIGVFNVDPSGSIDDLNDSTYNRVRAKYGDMQNWGDHAILRLNSWGFNSVAEYGSTYVYPFGRGSDAPRLPMTGLIRPSFYGLTNKNNYAPGSFKGLLDSQDLRTYTGWSGSDAPDVFDPNFEAYVVGWLQTSMRDPFWSEALTSPWVIGTATDDADDLQGFGPGTEIPGTDGYECAHIGWLALSANPNRTSSQKYGVSYADPKIYTKYALRGFLASHYRNSISALNASWGSNYISFDSAGGWGRGNGLLDESGRHVSWLGQTDGTLRGASPGVSKDLDDFLYQYSFQYFSIVSRRLRQFSPGHLVFGPSTLNSHGGLTRKQILRAAAENVDVLQAGVGDSKLLAATMAYVGNKPIVTWEGWPANTDSSLWRYAHHDATGPSTQRERARKYARQLSFLFNATSSGIKPIVGLKWWAWEDSWGEKTNWGLTSFLDNAYDGKEAVRAPGKDRGGYQTGGEERNYGDFITEVSRANARLIDSLREEIPGTGGGRREDAEER